MTTLLRKKAGHLRKPAREVAPSRKTSGAVAGEVRAWLDGKGADSVFVVVEADVKPIQVIPHVARSRQIGGIRKIYQPKPEMSRKKFLALGKELRHLESHSKASNILALAPSKAYVVKVTRDGLLELANSRLVRQIRLNK